MSPKRAGFVSFVGFVGDQYSAADRSLFMGFIRGFLEYPWL
jgi:hypothetical protein